ncbi:MAG: phenylalanine--tRNA ligase subunit beta [Patescibacteria group bacterium]
MLFSYNWLQEYVKKELPKPEKLAELLNMHSFEVENFKKTKDDWIFDIKVLPNRAHDCLCHTGIAREIAAITKGRMQLPKTKKIKTQKGKLAPLKVRIQSSELVPRYTALVIEGVTVGKSPKWLKERLQSVGVNSIDNVVDLANFVMLELGQPLHAFDYDRIEGNQMFIREAKKGEKLETLDEKALTLSEGMLVIQDAHRLIDLAGIKGGKVSGISHNTENIVLQAANFNAASIYQTKSKLQYQTPAANIYAHQIDPSLTIEALERAAELLSELKIQGKITQVVDINPQKVKPKRIVLPMHFLESLLGIPILQKETKQILQSLDCKVKMRQSHMEVTVPLRRVDLTIPEDLAEEIGRIHGYETIPAIFPTVSLALPPKNSELLWQEKIRDAFKEIGFTEVYNYSLLGEKDFSQFFYSKKEKDGLVALENPQSSDFSHLRGSLMENLLKNVGDNQKKTRLTARRVIRIFEIGNVFSKDQGKFNQTHMLGAIVSDGGFYEMKGICDFLLNSLGITDISYDEYQATPEKSRSALWNKAKSAELKVDSQEIGFLGEISSALASSVKITKPVGALSINVDKLILLASEEKAYQVPSRFPASTRDIAILVPLQTKVSEVMNVIERAGGTLVSDIDLFDIYEGENFEQGKKSLAFHIVYQADDRTLTALEVDTMHNQIIKAVQENPEWEVRK